MGTRVFVYGSLRQGFGNHALLSKATAGEPAMTAEPRFHMLDMGSYPGVVEGGDCWIYGEVYEVDELTLRRLDKLEGHPRFYERKEVLLTDGELAWMYVLSPAFLGAAPVCWPVVYSGDWQLR